MITSPAQCGHACMQAEALYRDHQAPTTSTTAVVLSPHVAQCAALRTRLAQYMLGPALTVDPATYGCHKAMLDEALWASLEAAGLSTGASDGSTAEQDGRGGAAKRFIRVVDTVEKLQGQEADIVVYSACVSDAAALAKAGDFYANLRRANVAFTRTRQRLIVVASRSMLAHAPSAMDQYNQVTECNLIHAW